MENKDVLSILELQWKDFIKSEIKVGRIEIKTEGKSK
jgi:hypothetical protein